MRFETTNVTDLRTIHGDKFQSSRTPLLDSKIFCCRTRGTTETVPADQQRRLYR
jgi:hypothetical protein